MKDITKCPLAPSSEISTFLDISESFVIGIIYLGLLSIVGVRWLLEDLTGSGIRLNVSLLICINPSTIGFVAHKLCRIMLDPHCI